MALRVMAAARAAATASIAPARTARATASVAAAPRLVNALRVGDAALKLEFSDGGVARFHHVFLRDHCPCAACRHPGTGQRLFDTAALPGPGRLRADDVAVSPTGDALTVSWGVAPAGAAAPGAPHMSTFPSAFLASHAYWSNVGERPPGGAAADPATDASSRVLWGAAHFGGAGAPLAERPFPRVPHAAWMADDGAVLSGLLALRDYGVVLVEGVPHTDAATEAALRRIAFLRPTMYSAGGMWRTEVRADGAADNTDTAYSTLALPAHTDGNYFTEPPGLQAFHALVADAGGGGDSLLVDGFAVGEQLRAADPEAFALLCAFPLRYAHTEAATVVTAEHAVFALRDDGGLAAVRFNNDDRASVAPLPSMRGVASAARTALGGAPADGAAPSPLASPTVVPRLYAALAALLRTLRAPSNEVWLGLRPGTLLIFDNGRVLHGRSALSSARSRRVLAGAYIGADEWRGRLRALVRAGVRPALAGHDVAPAPAAGGGLG